MGYTMEQAKKILDDMETLLDRLIESAKKLLTLSQQVIEEDELTSLQQHQEVLLENLIQKDADFHKLPNISQATLISLRRKIDTKIDDFQKLNADFLENLNKAHGLIQFNKGHLKKHPKQKNI